MIKVNNIKIDSDNDSKIKFIVSVLLLVLSIMWSR